MDELLSADDGSSHDRHLLEFNRWIVILVADLPGIGQPIAPVHLHRALSGSEQAPCLTLVGPVVGLQAVGFTQGVDGVVQTTDTMEVLADFEVCGGSGPFDRSRATLPQYRLGRERKAALSTMSDPIAQRGDVFVRLDPKLFDFRDPGDLAGCGPDGDL